ncbi:hypothetical protein [Bartonella sp. LJL80]
MTDLPDPVALAKHRLRRRFFILLALAIILIALLVWMTLAVLDANGIDAFDAIV